MPFSVSPGELIVVLIIALLVFGPRRLPEIGRTVGKGLREFRRASQEIRSELQLGLDDEPPMRRQHDDARWAEETGEPTEPGEAGAAAPGESPTPPETPTGETSPTPEAGEPATDEAAPTQPAERQTGSGEASGESVAEEAGDPERDPLQARGGPDR